MGSFIGNILLWFVAATACVASAQDEPVCDQASKVISETPVQLSDFAGLVSVVNQIPEACGSFNLFSLSTCKNDIEFSEGCCEADCVGVFADVTIDCLHGLFVAVCELNPSIAPVLENLARRCKAGFTPRGCVAVGNEDFTEAPANTTTVVTPRHGVEPGVEGKVSADSTTARAPSDGAEPGMEGEVAAEQLAAASDPNSQAGNSFTLCGTLVGVAALAATLLA